MTGNENRLIVEGLFTGMLKRPGTEQEIQTHAEMIEAGFTVSDIIQLILQSEEYATLSKAKLFVPAGHFYSPIVNTDEAAKHLTRIDRSISSVPDVPINHSAMIELWKSISPYINEYPFGEEPKKPYRYGTNNNNYGLGDSAILFAMMRHFKPRNFIEVGSGWSSACALDTAGMFLKYGCKFTFIEPYPALVLQLIGNVDEHVEIIDCGVQDANVSYYDRLEDGDFLFIDSTHVVRTGSDVCFEIFEILPRLKKGVIVHIHDMFWPFEYPRHWVIDENRSWNELYLVRALLMNNDAWDVLYFNDYFAKIEGDMVAKNIPEMLKNPGGGLWLRKR